MNLIHFIELLAPKRITEIVDIGANPIDGEPPYLPMLKSGEICRVTGFEPQEAALQKLIDAKSKQERYLPYVVGDGSERTLNICFAEGMTSLLKPNKKILEIFQPFEGWGEVVSQHKVLTKTLDSIEEIEELDYLKIDIQGGELDVFRHGRSKLTKTVLIQTEVSFIPLYENQPTFSDIDIELRAQGFIPHFFPALKNWMISPLVINNDPRIPLNQLIEADIVYVKDFTKPENISDEQLKHLALIAHACYGSFDLSMRCIAILEQRGAIPVGSMNRYPSMISRD
jgi:FkbM family methyltransferase